MSTGVLLLSLLILMVVQFTYSVAQSTPQLNPLNGLSSLLSLFVAPGGDPDEVPSTSSSLFPVQTTGLRDNILVEVFELLIYIIVSLLE